MAKPAFNTVSGIDKREYFAAAAMQALIAAQAQAAMQAGITPVPRITVARWAYEYADAMLVAGST